MPSLDGMPSAAQITLFTDSLASVLKYTSPNLGILAEGDVTSSSYYADRARTKILGDGGSNPGLGAPAWEGNVTGALNSLATGCRYDMFFSTRFQSLVGVLDSLVGTWIPTGWKFASTSTQAHVFDRHLMRLNALCPSTPATPTATPVLTAVNSPLGAIPNVVSGSAPRVVVTFVGQFDYWESLPSAEATQVALTGSHNSYGVALSGTVPTGVYKVRVYRGVVGGSFGGPYEWDSDWVCTAGSAFPAITLVQPDSMLRTDVNPPAWMSAMITPEFAAEFALAYGTSSGSFSSSGSNATGVSIAGNGQLSPISVAANPANGFLGVGNPASSAIFCTSTITAANTQTAVSGTLQVTCNSLANIQGFAGSAGGLRARVTSALAGGVTAPTISYTYLAAASGQTVQTQTGVAASAFATGLLGDVVTFSVASGRLVLSASVTSVSGAATSGVFVTESLPVRSI